MREGGLEPKQTRRAVEAQGFPQMAGARCLVPTRVRPFDADLSG